MNPITTFIASLDRSSNDKASNVTVSRGGIDGLMISVGECFGVLKNTKAY